jgi:hybrid cluster-associated redox disulfide protein
MKKIKRITKNRSKNAKRQKSKSNKNKKTNEINKKMTFAEIINKNPGAVEILMARGLHCVGCGMAFQETLEQGAIMHGINPDKLVKELNRKIKQK